MSTSPSPDSLVRERARRAVHTFRCHLRLRECLATSQSTTECEDVGQGQHVMS
jgi:hypothetical protein